MRLPVAGVYGWMTWVVKPSSPNSTSGRVVYLCQCLRKLSVPASRCPKRLVWSGACHRGDYGLGGAAILAAGSALRAGAEQCDLCHPGCSRSARVKLFPDIMFRSAENPPFCRHWWRLQMSSRSVLGWDGHPGEMSLRTGARKR